MLAIMITESMVRVFAVTDLTTKNNSKFYFLKEENIKNAFEDAVWEGYAKADSKYVINGVFLEPEAIEELSNENKVYELVYP